MQAGGNESHPHTKRCDLLCFIDLFLYNSLWQLVLVRVKLHTILSVLRDLTKKAQRYKTKLLTNYALFVNEDAHLGCVPQGRKIFLELCQNSKHKIIQHLTVHRAQTCVNNNDKPSGLFSTHDKIKTIIIQK